MKGFENNGKSESAIKTIIKTWRMFRDWFKSRWVQWPYDHIGEKEFDRYLRVEHPEEYKIRRPDIAEILKRRYR